MQAKDVMTRNVVAVTTDTSVVEIAQQLIARGISAVPVVDGAGKIVGIVSEGDLMRRDESGTGLVRSWWLSLFEAPEERATAYVKSHGRTAGDVMTSKVLTVSENAELADIAALLEKHRIKRVPVVRDGKPVGIVSRSNLLQGLAAAKPIPPVSADDAAIREALRTALKESGVDQVFVNAVVANGVVNMWGEVNSAAEVRALEVAARSVSGVKNVENHVNVADPNRQAMTWA